MKTKLIYNLTVLLALFAFSVSLGAAQSRSEKEEEGLRGSVKTIKVEKANILNGAAGPTESPRIMLARYSFDKEGNGTWQLVNDESGVRKLENGWINAYDSEGREIRKEYLDSQRRVTSVGITTYSKGRSDLTQYNFDGTVNHIWQSFFDDSGNLVREVRVYPTGRGFESLYKYDGNGHLIERINREPGGKVLDTGVMTYDNHGARTSWVVHKADGSVLQMFKSQFDYDGSGNVIGRRDYDPDGSLFNKETYTYEFDAMGNWTKLAKARQRFSRKAITYQQEVLYRQITYF